VGVRAATSVSARLAYNHLGSVGDAEDVVQEAWLRLERAGGAEIGDLRAWLSTTVARLAIDALTSARARRERYVGTWLPEPLVRQAERTRISQTGHARRVGQHGAAGGSGIADAARAQRLPAPRRVRLSFERVAGIVGRGPQPTRQLAARARRRVEAARPRGIAARRAVVRWAWRMFRREWRQQLLVVGLLTVAVAAAVGSITVVYNTAPADDAEFGSANHVLRFDAADPRKPAAGLTAAKRWFGRADVVAHSYSTVPGGVERVYYLALEPGGAYVGHLLALRRGSYP
jgi:Sigma-70 region 2